MKLFPLEYPHTFTSQLKGQTVVEHDRAEFEIDVEAEDAEVTWYRDGKKIIPEQVRKMIACPLSIHLSRPELCVREKKTPTPTPPPHPPFNLV